MTESHGFTQGTQRMCRRMMHGKVTYSIFGGQYLDMTRTAKVLLHLSMPISSSLQGPV